MGKNTLEYYMALPYKLEITPDAEEGGYTASYPELPGCITCAETWEQLSFMALDAKRTWLEDTLENGREIAEPWIFKELRKAGVEPDMKRIIDNALNSKL